MWIFCGYSNEASDAVKVGIFLVCWGTSNFSKKTMSLAGWLVSSSLFQIPGHLTLLRRNNRPWLLNFKYFSLHVHRLQGCLRPERHSCRHSRQSRSVLLRRCDVFKCTYRPKWHGRTKNIAVLFSKKLLEDGVHVGRGGRQYSDQ
jgi:hypothetical protein